MEKAFKELMEKDSRQTSEVVKEVREMRRKISEEFDNDLEKFIAYCPKKEREWKKTGKYNFANSDTTTKETKSAGSEKVEAAD